MQLSGQTLSRLWLVLCAAVAGLLLLCGNFAVAAPTLLQALDGTNLVWQTGGNANWFGQTTNTHDGIDAAQSGFITNDQESWIQTTVTGPGPLSFWWKVSSEMGYDVLQFILEGVETNEISGEVDWQQRNYNLPPGTHVLRWRFSKDSSDEFPVGLNTAWLDQVQYTPPVDSSPLFILQPASQTVAAGAMAVFTADISGFPQPAFQWYFGNSRLSGATTNTLWLPNVTTNDAGYYRLVASNYLGSVTSAPALLTVTMIGDAVDAPDLFWRIGGDQPWFGQMNVTHDGIDAAQSGAITNYQESWLTTTITGPGTLTFWWRVSSEPTYDTLQFLTNGIVVSELSGRNGSWQQKSCVIAGASVTLRWRYHKDGSFNEGSDCGWVDEISFIPDKEPSPFYLRNPAWSAASGFQALLQGETNRLYLIEASTNLTNWATLTNVIGGAQFRDTNAPITRRFYRALAP